MFIIAVLISITHLLQISLKQEMFLIYLQKYLIDKAFSSLYEYLNT